MIDEENSTSLHAVRKAMGKRPLYRDRIGAIRNNIPYPGSGSGADANGCLVLPPHQKGRVNVNVVSIGAACVRIWEHDDANRARRRRQLGQ